MVTRQQLTRLADQIETLAGVIDPDAEAITVTVFAGETPEFAARRHCELRPTHVSRAVRFNYQPLKRDYIHEMFAVWGDATEADRRVVRAWLEAMQERAKDTPCNFVGVFGEKDAT